MASVRKCGSLLVLATITILALSSTVSSLNPCDHTIFRNGTSNYVTSPGYPSNYTSNLNCVWNGRANSPTQVVLLNLQDFYLEGSPPSCSYDYLTIYDGPTNSSPIIQKLCGQVSSTQIASSGMYMLVAFHSDYSVNYKGFKFNFLLREKSAQCADVRLTASTYINYFSSSNYPGQYPSNMDCKWLIKADSTLKVVVLDISAFSVAYSSSCASDYVKIYDGPSTYSTLIATLCDVNYYGKYKSTGSDMTVVFHSDGVTSGNTGFQFSYKSELPASDNSGTIAQCADVNLTASKYANYFNSSKYPGQYPSNMDCKWFITADSALKVVVLNISAFSVEKSPYCFSEYVKIYDGPSTYSTLIATLCDVYYYGTYKSTGFDMTVVFHSDGVNSTNTGFKFSFKSELPPVSDIPRTIGYYPSTYTSSSKYLPGYIAGPFVGVVVSLISAVCCRRRLVRRQLRATQMVPSVPMVATAPAPRPAPPPVPAPNIIGNQNARQANVFFVPIESNNQAEAPTDTTRPKATSGTAHNPQVPPDPPRYSSLNCDINASLPPYDPRDPNYRAMHLPPAYSEMAGGAAPYVNEPLPYDPKPDTSPLGLGSSSDEAEYANMGFSSDAATGPPTSSHRDTEPSAPARDSIYNN